MQLHDEFSSEVACASLNIDYYGSEDETPEDVKPRVVEFLTPRNATMQNFISSDADDKILEHIKTVSIPASIVYDREGNRHTIFNNDNDEYGPEGFGYEKDVKPLVKKLLEVAE